MSSNKNEFTIKFPAYITGAIDYHAFGDTIQLLRQFGINDAKYVETGLVGGKYTAVFYRGNKKADKVKKMIKMAEHCAEDWG